MRNIIRQRHISRFDDLGRIAIPKEIRKRIFGTKNNEGEWMEVFIQGKCIILKKYEYKEKKQ